MAMNSAYLGLLALVAAGRLVELRISRRNQRALAAQGVPKIHEPHFRWMVLVHAGILGGAALEVILLRRPLVPVLAISMGVVFLLANFLRWWVMRSLAGYWNVEVMASPRVGVVTSGPYRWIRHPNYVAVVAELFSLPMIHTAWITALAGTAANLEILRRRLQVEDGVLMADPLYRASMGAKPRFLPRIFRSRPIS
ncbi:MAG: isoprenylcysteine carboxyl methyltransferase family protein [Candidatus Acidiferrales bacterium]